MGLEKLFAEALGIREPWAIKAVKFDSMSKKLDIKVDFERGATFEYEDPKTKEVGSYKVYDTVNKTWRR